MGLEGVEQTLSRGREEMNAAEEKVLIKKHADKWRKENGYKDFLEEAEKEKAELNESYKEAVRQTKERDERSKR